MAGPAKWISKCIGHGTQKSIANHHSWPTRKTLNCRYSRKATQQYHFDLGASLLMRFAPSARVGISSE